MSPRRRRLTPDELVAAARTTVAECAMPAFLVGADSRIMAWNGAASEFFGIPAWNASALSCALVVHGCLRDGKPVCTPGCWLLNGKKAGPVPEAMEMVIRTGRPPSGQRLARVIHTRITHPRAGQLGLLHTMIPIADEFGS
ncbi:MAG: hypothetical protein E6I85_05405 [Chloroflexi bacterium]|nr:MAG: hypothetical protein E6I85_05405 [Chloroflexota bacterium]